MAFSKVPEWDEYGIKAAERLNAELVQVCAERDAALKERDTALKEAESLRILASGLMPIFEVAVRLYEGMIVLRSAKPSERVEQILKNDEARILINDTFGSKLVGRRDELIWNFEKRQLRWIGGLIVKHTLNELYEVADSQITIAPHVFDLAKIIQSRKRAAEKSA